MSLCKIRQDFRNALFIGGAAAAAFLLVTWNRLDRAEKGRQRWLETLDEESVPSPGPAECPVEVTK